MKKLLMLACLLVVLAPHSAKAKDHKHQIRANELAGIGIGAAALIGVVGYFALRRRNTV